MLWMSPTLLGAVTLIVLLMRRLPGNVALSIVGSGESSDINQQALEQIRQKTPVISTHAKQPNPSASSCPETQSRNQCAVDPSCRMFLHMGEVT